MKNQMFKLGLIAMTLPFVGGCGGGGAAMLGSLLGGATTGAAAAATGGATLLAAAGDAALGGAVSSMVNPEPATMLLLGSGVVAMGLLKRSRQK